MICLNKCTNSLCCFNFTIQPFFAILGFFQHEISFLPFPFSLSLSLFLFLSFFFPFLSFRHIYIGSMKFNENNSNIYATNFKTLVISSRQMVEQKMQQKLHRHVHSFLELKFLLLHSGLLSI